MSPQLDELSLDHTQVTDKGMELLTQMKNLRRLDLDGTNVTDNGLETLAAAQELKSVSVRDAQVTPAGVCAFVTRNRSCSVTFGSKSDWKELSWTRSAGKPEEYLLRKAGKL